jgi:hypothetical protein
MASLALASLRELGLLYARASGGQTYHLQIVSQFVKQCFLSITDLIDFTPCWQLGLGFHLEDLSSCLPSWRALQATEPWEA